MSRPYTSEAFDDARLGARMASQPLGHRIESRGSDAELLSMAFGLFRYVLAPLLTVAACIALLTAAVGWWTPPHSPAPSSHEQER